MAPPERAVNKSSEALVKCLAPDVCLTPMGSSVVPVPYTITSKFNVAEKTAPKVNYGGLPAFTMESRLPRVEGDEQGTGGGILSKVNRGYCRPVAHSGTVRAHGQYVIRHGDLMHMNCNGPDGPSNTVGRVVYVGVGGAGEVPRETLQKEQRVTVDAKTGKTLVGEREITRDPRTGAVTEMRQRTLIDPSTGEIQTQRALISTGPEGGRSYEAASGHFDPASQSYTWETSAGSLPAADLGGGGPILGDGAIGTVGGDGRIYLGDGMYGEPGPVEPAGSLEIPDDDPELLGDPEYQAVLQEQAAAEAEIAGIDKELAWEAAKAGVDVAGLVDPTPISDAIGAGMALSEGDFLGAGLSVVSMVPYLGDALGKSVKGARAAAKLARLTEKLAELRNKLKKLADLVAKAKHKVKEALRRKRGGGGAPPPPPKKPDNPGDGGNVPSGPNNPYTKLTREQLEKTRRSFEKLVKEHEQKLADYKSNPFKHDNLGKLKDAPPEIQRKIIAGRIVELESQIAKQRGELQKVLDALDRLPGG